MAKIFIVDDDISMINLYERIFRLNNIQAEVVIEADTVIEKLKSSDPKPNLIVLDVLMPKISGFELLKQIKQDPELKNIPVMILSNLSLGGEDLTKKSMEMGAVGYLVKSENGPEELVEKLKKYLV